MSRDDLIAAITAFLAGHELRTLEDIRAALRSAIDGAGPSALEALEARLKAPCDEWAYYPPDPLARHIHHLIADRLLAPGSALAGAAHLAAAAGRPTVIVANHLSYSDANLLEILFHRAGAGAIAARLTAMAGPKVYSSGTRRFSSLCFGTIKTPQSSARSSDEAVMQPRDVARAARRCIDVAHERLRAGDALLVFAEGSRSRTAEMQQTLAGVSRYLDTPGTLVLPIGIVGTETLFPIGAQALTPVRIVARVGPPIDADALRARCDGDRRLVMDAVGEAIAALLPTEYRGVYARKVS